MPHISVIMPCLNVVKYIDKCICSVVTQTEKDIEIIIVDAGSTDGTLEVISTFAEKDSRITLIHSDKRSDGYQMFLWLKANMSVLSKRMIILSRTCSKFCIMKQRGLELIMLREQVKVSFNVKALSGDMLFFPLKN